VKGWCLVAPTRHTKAADMAEAHSDRQGPKTKSTTNRSHNPQNRARHECVGTKQVRTHAFPMGGACFLAACSSGQQGPVGWQHHTKRTPHGLCKHSPSCNTHPSRASQHAGHHNLASPKTLPKQAKPSQLTSLRVGVGEQAISCRQTTAPKQEGTQLFRSTSSPT